MRLKELLSAVLVATALSLPRVFAQTPAEARAPAVESALAERLDAAIDRALQGEQIVGVVVIVARDGEVVYHRAAGLADREAGRPAEEDTIFRLASMTKPIVSAAALALADEGALGLDDPVTRWLPDFRPRLADGREPTITVRHLLMHTAGLNYASFEPPHGPYRRAGVSDGLDQATAHGGGRLTLEENLERIASTPLLFEPGTQWRYSLATDVLGAVVANAGGAPLPEVVARTVTRPLGMADTAFIVTDAARLAAPYENDDPRPRRIEDGHVLTFGLGGLPLSPSRATDPDAYPSGGAGMSGTARDYLRFLEAVRTGGGGFLRPETARVFSSGTPAMPMGGGWTFGLGVSVLQDPAVAEVPQNPGSWQWGGVFGTHFWVDPIARTSVVVMTNTTPAGLFEFPRSIVDAAYGSGAAK